MIIAGERLIADRGIPGLSLREVGTSAGARNNSAVQYHFGSKQGLVDAIFGFRMAPINRMRIEMIREVALDLPRDQRLRRLVEAMVVPFIDVLSMEPGSTCYGRFLCQVVADPHNAARLSRIDGPETEGLLEIVMNLQEMLVDIPVPIRRQRLSFAITLNATVVADYERARDAGLLARLNTPDLLASGLIDTIVGLIDAPLSDRTVAALGDHGEWSEREGPLGP